MRKNNHPRPTEAPPESEIIDQVKAIGEPQDDGTVQITEEQAEELGGIDAEAIRANAFMRETAVRKKAGFANVTWGTQDFTLMYDQAIRIWPPSTMHIHITRLTGTPITVYLRGEPRSGKELYEAILAQVHRRSDEAEYKLTLRDKQQGSYRANGRLILPDTRDDPNAPADPASQAQQPMPPAPFRSHPYAPPYRPNPYAFDAAALPTAPVAPPPPSPPQPPASHSDPVIAQLLAHVQSLTQHVVAMSAQQQPPARAAPMPPAPAPVAPVAPIAPPAPPPMMHPPPPEGATFLMPGVGWVTRARAPGPEAAPPSAIDQMRASLATVGQMVQTIEEAKRAVPGLGQVPKIPVPAPPEPDPIKSVDVGEYKLIQSTEDGSFRPVETLVANAPKIFEFISRETEKYAEMQRKNAERQRAAAPQASAPALPEGTAPA